MTVGSDMKNPYIIPSLIIAAAILAGFWMLKTPPQPPQPPDISIHQAARTGNIKAVKQHLAAGTDVNVKGGFDKGTPLHSVTRHGHKEIAELLIDKGADVNAKDEHGEAPLLYAILNGHKELANLLRKHGAKTGEELK